MKSLITLGRADTYDHAEDYEVVNLNDKGVTFRTPENELVWMDIDEVLGGLIDGSEDTRRNNSDIFAVMWRLSVHKP